MIVGLIAALVLASGAMEVPSESVTWLSGDDCLQYDDGVPAWLSWGGSYRGTWFNTADFYSEECQLMLGAAELWFMHGVYPWDTSEFTAQVHNGGPGGPVELLFDTTLVASHMTGVIVEFPDSIETEADFWIGVSTELSSGGWPSNLADAENSGHSYLSEDFVTWDEAVGDWFIRGHGSPLDMALQSDTWGGIKALF